MLLLVVYDVLLAVVLFFSSSDSFSSNSKHVFLIGKKPSTHAWANNSFHDVAVVDFAG